MKTAVRCCLVFASLALAPFASIGARAADAVSTASAVPLEVPEMVSGGAWSDGGLTGAYRAMVVMPAAAGPANVVVQLITIEKGDTPPKVVKTVPIKEVAAQSFSSAFLAMDAENENEMTLIVTAYGSGTDQDTSMQFKFDAKGNYKVLPGPGDEPPADSDPATKN